MRVSLQWLKELVQTSEASLEPEALAERLSVAGFEVESIERLDQQAAGVVVGLVCERQPHPDATKLSVCQVDVGADAPLQIVCGASNVRAGIHVPVALVGATLPAVGLTIKPAELRGVASSGMICSLTELGLSDGSDGIAVLDDLLDTVPPLGSAVAPHLGLDDTVLELAITANRPDGLSMQGIAREVAALSGGHTVLPSSPSLSVQPLPVSEAQQRAFEDGGLFSLTALEGVQVAPSPLWLRRRLEKAGVRPINNVVDVTNLVMLETGQPLHAFDSAVLAQLSSLETADPAAVGLRQARPGESFTTLDAETRTLDDNALVVTYADRPIALAGVMGGAAEAVTATTTTIWLEAAVFSAAAVRTSARSQGLRTEASSRFEKGLPPEATLTAADRAVALLQQIAGARPLQRWLHQLPQQERQPLLLRRDALLNLLGPLQSQADGDDSLDLQDGEIEETLIAIGCHLVSTDEGWLVQVPAQRAIDLRREVDLIEEVARLVGYDRFGSHLPDPLEPGGLDAAQQAERRLRRALCSAGLQELCSFSLVPAAEGRIPLANPLLSDYGHLRDGLHGELLAAAARNLQNGQRGFWGFEIGNVFTPGGSGEQRNLLGGVICGSQCAELWTVSGKPQPLTYHAARGRLQQALESLLLSVEDRPLQGHSLLHPGRAAGLWIEGRCVGWFGQLHPQQAIDMDLPELTYGFELDLAVVLTAATRTARWRPAYKPYATVPASERDVAVVVSELTPSADLLALMRKAGRPLLEHVELIDTYSSEQLGEGVCSQAFRLRYRDPKRTLTDADVDQAHARVRTTLESANGIQLRS
jgi:phenylalanyl-tRNA synthetase beta chain